MNRKNELLNKAQTSKLSMSERGELRELHLWEEKQMKRAQDSLKESVSSFQDDYNRMDTPKHRALEKGIHFIECPLCKKNRNTNSSLLREYNYMMNHPEDFCMKPELHNEKNFNMLIRPEYINLDAE